MSVVVFSPTWMALILNSPMTTHPFSLKHCMTNLDVLWIKLCLFPWQLLHGIVHKPLHWWRANFSSPTMPKVCTKASMHHKEAEQDESIIQSALAYYDKCKDTHIVFLFVPLPSSLVALVQPSQHIIKADFQN